MSDRQLIADLLSALEYHTEQTRPIEFSKVAIEAARECLRKPEQPAQEPVAFLANGTRFKMSFFENEDGPGTHVTCFEAFEKELDGRWVALVAAEDDCHRNLTRPQAREPLTHESIEPVRRFLADRGIYLSDETTKALIEAANGIGEKK